MYYCHWINCYHSLYFTRGNFFHCYLNSCLSVAVALDIVAGQWSTLKAKIKNK